MKRLLFIIALFLCAAQAAAQDPTIDKGSGNLYFTGKPGITPNTTYGSEYAIDLNALKAYIWNRDSSAWYPYPDISHSFTTPSGDPGTDSKLHINRTTGDLYQWDGSVWEQVVASGFEFSKTALSTKASAESKKKTWVVSDTITVSGNLDVSDLDIIFEKRGFISGADTITASGATIIANPNKQLWSNTTVIQGDWDVDKSYLEWTIGSTRTDSIANYRALRNAIELGPVMAQAYEYPLAATSTTDSYSTTKDIIIEGVNRQSTIFRLITQHNTSSIADEAYFRSDNGNNVSLKNLTITTNNFEAGNYVTNERDYPFISCRYTTGTPNTKPRIEYVIYENITIKGSSGMSVAASDANQTNAEYPLNYIETVEIRNCYFEAVVSVFGLGGLTARNFVYENNNAKNIRTQTTGRSDNGVSQAFLDSIPKMNVLINGNTWVNDSVISGVPNGYLCPVVFQGGKVTFSNNYVEGLRTTGSSTEVYPWYYSGEEKITVINNKFVNVFGRATIYNAYCFDLKENLEQTIENNEFSLNKQTLVDCGVLDSLNQSYASVKDTLQYSIMKINPVDNAVRQRNLVFRNNSIKIPFLNSHVSIHSLSSLDFSNNSINVEYFGGIRSDLYGGTSFTVREGYFFWNRSSSDQSVDNRSWISKGNVITISDSQVDKIYYNVGYSLKTSSDTEVNFTSVECEDIWYVSDCAIIYSSPDADKVAIKSKAIGENNAIAYIEPENSTTTRIPSGKMVSDVVVSDFSDNDINGVALSYANSNYRVKALSNSSDTIDIFKHYRNNALYQNTDSLPLIYVVSLTGVDTLGNPIKQQWEWILTTFRAFRYLDASGTYTTTNGDSGSVLFRDTIKERYGVNSAPFMLLEQQPLGGGVVYSWFKVSKAELLGSFDLSVEIKRYYRGDNQTYLERSFTPPLHGVSGKELFLTTLSNPLGGSNEAGAVVDSVYNSLDSRITDLESGASYGEAYIDYIDPDSVTIVTAGTLYDFADVLEGSSSGDVTVSTTTGRLTYTGTAEKLFVVTWTATVTSDATNENLIGTVIDNGATITRIRWEEEDTAAGDTHSVAASGFFSMGQNDWVQPKLTSQSNGTQIQVITMSFRIQEVR